MYETAKFIADVIYGLCMQGMVYCAVALYIRDLFAPYEPDMELVE